MILVRDGSGRRRRDGGPTAEPPSSATSRRPGPGRHRRAAGRRVAPSTRMASPWPTSSTVTRASPAGRAATTSPVTRTVSGSDRGPRRVQRRGGRTAVRTPSMPAGRVIGAGRPGRRDGGMTEPAGAPSDGDGIDHRAAARTAERPLRDVPGARASTLANGTAPDPDHGRPSRRRGPTREAGERRTTGGRRRPRASPRDERQRPARHRRGTSGTTARLTTGETSDSRPNVASTSGGSPPARRARRRGSRRASAGTGRRPTADPGPPMGFAQARSPAVARTESRNPASPMRPGSTSSRSDRRRAERRRRPPGAPELAREQHDARHHAPPGRPTARRPANDDVGDDRDGRQDRRAAAAEPRRRAPTSAATIAMFQPEIATTWLTPAVVKSAARSRSTRSRRPMRMPAASPASGSGSDGRKGRRRRRVAGAPGSRPGPASPLADGSIIIEVARSVPLASIRRR